MLSSVLTARDKYLKRGGLLLPSTATIFVGAVSDAALWADKVEWWSSVYGYDMRVFARHAWPEPIVEAIKGDSLASAAPHSRLAHLDLSTMAHGDVDIEGAPFTLDIVGDNAAAARSPSGDTVTVHALAVWFSVGFPAGAGDDAGAAGIVLDTAPDAAPTHWFQTILLLREPAVVPTGAQWGGALSMVRDARNPREYRFAVDFGGKAAGQAWHMK